MIRRSKEYKAIKDFYQDRTAARSGVLLMNHIEEGLEILKRLDSNLSTMKAYCIHPLLQSDKDLQKHYKDVNKFSSAEVILLVLEYRRVANSFLCRLETDNWTLTQIKEAIGLLLPEVKEMLIADKIQNQKDFLKYHKDTHVRSRELDIYFKKWLEFLNA